MTGGVLEALYLELDIARIAAMRALQPLWKGAVFSKLSHLHRLRVSPPDLPPRWVRLKPLLSGICGSDLQLLQLKTDLDVAPVALPANHRLFLGHEVAALVQEANGSKFRPGDRVALRVVDYNCWAKDIDPSCRNCADGNYSLCENFCAALNRIPKNAGAGWADGFVAHEEQLYMPPAEFSDEAVALLEPGACALHGVMRRPPGPEQKVLVIGGGSIGLLAMMAVKFLEPRCELTALVRHDFQASWARQAGADRVVMESSAAEEMPKIAGGRLFRGPAGSWMMLGGFDTVYDCAVTSISLTSALRWTRSRGAVVILGVNLRPRRFDYTPVWYQEVDLIGSIGHGMEIWQGRPVATFDLTCELFRRTSFDVGRLVTHRFALEEFRTAIDTAWRKSRSGAIKVVFEFRQPHLTA